jgi:hypothetical protein
MALGDDSMSDARLKSSLVMRVVRPILHAVPLILLVATLVIWAWSYRTSGTVDWFPPGRARDFTLSWVDGLLCCSYTHIAAPTPPMEGVGLIWSFWPGSRSDRAVNLAWWRSLLVHFKHGPFIYADLSFDGFSTHTLQLPFWSVSLLFSISPLLSIYRWNRRRRRRLLGRCVKCGYDLRASESLCPECGTPMIRPSSKAASV